VWDHFFPLYADPAAAHFECYALLAAMAVETEHAHIGALVTCNSYRNPNLLADMARTIDHLSEGRFVLGIGAGWFQRDYDEYGYEFGTAPSRLRDLSEALPRIMERLDLLTPPPRGACPILVGGGGPKVTLRLTAEHADAWNSFGPPDAYAEKNRTLDAWCEKLGRNPRQIERTVGIQATEIDDWEAYLDAGAEHIIVMAGPPFDLAPTRRLLEIARSS
jgi:probable F420-dependent oxidoreductase